MKKLVVPILSLFGDFNCIIIHSTIRRVEWDTLESLVPPLAVSMGARLCSFRDTSSRTLHPSGVVATGPVARLQAGVKVVELSFQMLLPETQREAATDPAVGLPLRVTINWTLADDLPPGLLAEQV